jgi:hypothetical protein
MIAAGVGLSGFLKDSLILIKGINASVAFHKKIINSLMYASVQKFYNVTMIGRITNRLSNDIYRFGNFLS